MTSNFFTSENNLRKIESDFSSCPYLFGEIRHCMLIRKKNFFVPTYSCASHSLGSYVFQLCLKKKIVQQPRKL